MPNRANPNSPLRPRTARRPASLAAVLLAALVCAPAAWPQTPQAGEGTTRRQAPATKQTAPATKPAARPEPSKPVPEACADKVGIQRLTCTECDGLMPHRRMICEQKLFWSHCGKGMRLFKDSWCGDHAARPN